MAEWFRRFRGIGLTLTVSPDSFPTGKTRPGQNSGHSVWDAEQSAALGRLVRENHGYGPVSQDGTGYQLEHHFTPALSKASK